MKKTLIIFFCHYQYASLAAGYALFFMFAALPAFSRELPLDTIKLPPGFKISLYAVNVPGARSMTLSPDGTLFVGTRGDKIYALPNRNQSKHADEVIIFASGLNTANGVALRDGALFVAEINRILRFDNAVSRLRNAPEPIVVNSSFPSDIESAADSGLGAFPAVKGFLLSLLQQLTAASDRPAAAILAAAARLGGQQPEVSPEVHRAADGLLQAFLADELRSKPISFYAWNQKFTRIFKRDRMLQSPIEEPEARALALALSKDAGLMEAYAAALNLREKLTNPLACRDLREMAAALQEGGACGFDTPVSLFPPSRAHETELIKKLYGDRPIPEGFNLADDMIRRIHAGTLDLKTHSTRIFVDAGRAFALAFGIGETNTSQRLRLAGRRLNLDELDVTATTDAYHFLQMLRLRAQRGEFLPEGRPDGAGAATGRAPAPNRVDPDALNELDRRMLKEAFRRARVLQQQLQQTVGR